MLLPTLNIVPGTAVASLIRSCGPPSWAGEKSLRHLIKCHVRFEIGSSARFRALTAAVNYQDARLVWDRLPTAG
jgi:hypothetical protein